MRRHLPLGVLTLTLLLAVGAWVQAQQAPSQSANQYRPVYAPSYGGGGGGYWGWGGGAGTTVAGSYLQGMSSVINAAGQANLANSAAANNWENAYSMELNNRLQGTNTYFEQRRINREATAEERGPRVTQAELTRFAKEAAPARLTASQLDPVTGEIAWPAPLRDARYDAARKNIDQLFAVRENNAGAVGAAGYRQIHDAIEVLRAQFAKNITDYAPQAYVDARKFLDSLQYEASFAG
jgi:hypothetical protein